MIRRRQTRCQPEAYVSRVVFMGTPEFAVPCLQALYDHPAFEVVGVVTQPDRPAGRGQAVQPPPVKVRALELSLPIFQPETLRAEEAIAHLREWSPDVLVVVAFGQILRKPILELAPTGCLMGGIGGRRRRGRQRMKW